MRNKRLPIESLMDVLDTTRWCSQKSKILANARVDRRKEYGQRYFEILLKQGLIEAIKVTPVRPKYFITEKGRKILEDFKDLREIFKALHEEK